MGDAPNEDDCKKVRFIGYNELKEKELLIRIEQVEKKPAKNQKQKK